MPQRRGETEQEWMERLRSHRLMERTRAAVAYCNTTNDPGVNVAAFMALFHPETPDGQVREMMNDARSQRRR